MTLAQEFMKRALGKLKSRHGILSELERSIATLEEQFIDQVGKPGRDVEKLRISEELVGLLKTSMMMSELSDATVCGKCKDKSVVPAAEGSRACYKCEPKGFEE